VNGRPRKTSPRALIETKVVMEMKRESGKDGDGTRSIAKSNSVPSGSPKNVKMERNTKQERQLKRHLSENDPASPQNRRKNLVSREELTNCTDGSHYLLSSSLTSPTKGSVASGSILGRRSKAIKVLDFGDSGRQNHCNIGVVTTSSRVRALKRGWYQCLIKLKATDSYVTSGDGDVGGFFNEDESVKICDSIPNLLTQLPHYKNSFNSRTIFIEECSAGDYSTLLTHLSKKQSNNYTVVDLRDTCPPQLLAAVQKNVQIVRVQQFHEICMISGPQEAYLQVADIFDSLSKMTYYLGDSPDTVARISLSLKQLETNFAASLAESVVSLSLPVSTSENPSAGSPASAKNVFLDIVQNSRLQESLIASAGGSEQCTNESGTSRMPVNYSTAANARLNLLPILRAADDEDALANLPVTNAVNETLKRAVKLGHGQRETLESIMKSIQ